MYQLYQLVSLQLIFAITTRQNGDPCSCYCQSNECLPIPNHHCGHSFLQTFSENALQKSDIKGQILVIGKAWRPERPTLGSAEVVAGVGQREAGGMSKHARMHGRHERRLVDLKRISQKVLATLMGSGGGVAFDVYPASRLLAHAHMETPMAHR